ncbi:MAG: hypothetical protein NWF05_11685 [Candidatus Bathyarchaeota archaeon]|nr:hypothetical protein [Candidatus Bathyarchaeota archaeon]
MFVAVILISAVTITFSTIRYDITQGDPQTLSAIDETNLALKQVLGFTVGYYGSVLQVTGNSSYARELAVTYLTSGLENIGKIRPEWGPSFDVTALELSTNWFTNESYSEGNITIEYDLTGLGISGVAYATSCRLEVQTLASPVSDQARLNVFKDDNETLMNLGSCNFKFYKYVYSNSSWELITPTIKPTMFANGTYIVDIPPEIDADSYVLAVEDTRGIVTVASSFTRYTCTVNWSSGNFSYPNENLVVELLANGTLRWLGQSLNLASAAKPLPPVPVKAIHVNQTVNGVNMEVPFQIEDWASNYRVPLGLTSGYTVLSNRQMIVFLVNPAVSSVTVWWDGHDTANQTPYSIYSESTSPFKDDDVGNVNYGFLSNGLLDLTIDNSGGAFSVISSVNSLTSRAAFMRIGNEASVYGSAPSYVIHHGVVRDIVQAEPEWNDGPDGCPNTLGQVIITLPANVTYYTYDARLMLLNSQQSRQIFDFCPLKLYTASPISHLQTENGTATVTTNSSVGVASFYNYASGGWTAHHWSQFLVDALGTRGSGVMFTDTANQLLYTFDTPTSKTGAVKADYGNNKIELLPVTNQTQLSTSIFDVCWSGAVATFDGAGTTPIFKMAEITPTGLWVMAEYPPTIAVSADS